MLASLRDLPHALVFTDANSETASIRAAACAAFAFLGLDLDLRNDISPLDADLAKEVGAVRCC